MAHFLELWQPDVLCLQETKCPASQFPSAAFNHLGYRHVAQSGPAGYHGVAVLSRIPFDEVSSRQFCGRDDARHVAVRLSMPRPLWVHSLYVPAGGEVPDAATNPKFAHKLSFLDELGRWLPWIQKQDHAPSIVAGDFNVAPLENDVWSHHRLVKVVSHTPVETRRLIEIQAAGGWIDAARQHVPHEKIHTWWSYRAQDWWRADRGRRLDHIWLDPCLAGTCGAVETVREARSWTRPSDHVPVIASLDL